jgi:hypothetical protein
MSTTRISMHARPGPFLTLLVVLGMTGWSDGASAYRPFDGTDAAVADKGELEVELGPLGWLRQATDQRLVAPATIVNYGFAKYWELVLQGQGEFPLSSPDPASLTMAGAFLKHIVRPGVLQEQSGPSIATEFGVLLPGINAEPGYGLSWAGIVSQRWDWGTVHFNLQAELTREQHADVFVGAILEGPSKWKLRPVAEFFVENEFGQAQTFSALLGAIWQVRDNLSFDIGVRHDMTNGRPIDEIRAGLTFGVPLRLTGAGRH